MSWTADELEAIAEADELRIAPARADGTFRASTPIWVVRVGDDLFVRSYRGRDARWYRNAERTHRARIDSGGVSTQVEVADVGENDALNDSIDGAYRSKYERYGGRYVDPMVVPAARATSLRLVPR